MASEQMNPATAGRYIEEGAAFAELAGRGAGSSARDLVPERPARQEVERFKVVVIGAGQAGLSVGYHLARVGVPFVILDANERIGDPWRSRWDSLRLFTPARYDGLDGMPFPAPPTTFPTKDEMAEYLEAYAAKFCLPCRTGTRVDRLSRQGSRYIVETSGGTVEAEHVVVAMSSYQDRHVPQFSEELDPGIVQIHSLDYRSPAQLHEGAVLIVGAGNSGAEIAIETAPRHRTYVSGRDTGQIPFRVDGFAGRHLLARLVLRFLFHRVLTVDTPIGRKARPKVISQGGPLIRTKSSHLAEAGVERVAKTVGVREGLPLLEDGRTLDVANIIWCAGFRNRFAWIDLPVFDERREPLHERGTVTGEPGLHFVGLHFLYSLSSTMIHGVGRDARRVAERIASQVDHR